ncbi:UDP-Glc:alpha-D-GlcNAc-diphosphoundecaprenol beta-1,3-glucosyltransferase WfgD [Acaryochloris thomasi RCC1774]|uniref:UDP-Glc:alpha-D-GlcNAc-diphosphoundecaprenol beta-1,3-glucosyltransferase WfgD n=1 Tax=Acaryochloris thomasi RCC1774 TaxID=1764569 RepID=A0A2W1JLI8_9CYAN|nr:glycosyltransferase family 2 protein [Acaryochloris thomasi]PZD71772.1 UDP-Glc:alpha-D-GlcNAc-diphosphoundecaprenol beta-1,3-glucosyltransferase WfgD [Acaryochloris thomasi RCC1774]
MGSSIVSVVIPTRNRPELVKRAVHSALAQTLEKIEVCVVIDGPDPETFSELSKCSDSRLRVIQLASNKGGAGARNEGISKSQSEWIAFLDDDDEWLPQKLECQLEAATASQYQWPIITSFVTARTPKGEFTYPRRLPRHSEDLSEYLLARNTLSYGEGLIQTSTILTKRELLLTVPFREELPKHQDWDWILHVHSLEGVAVEFVPEALAVWHLWEQRASTSGNSNWENSLDWIQQNQHLITPRAYAAFVLVEVGSQAAHTRRWAAFWQLLLEAFRLGKPKPIDLFVFMGMWIVPQELRRSMKSLQSKAAQKLSHLPSLKADATG